MSLRTVHVFLREWLRAPLRTGAVLPSGEALVRAIARELEPTEAGTVVELGPGTGAVTRALLERGVAPERLVLVERNMQFVGILRRRFPNLTILQADATELRDLLGELGIGPVSAVVSSLPLRSLPFAVQRHVLRASFGVLGPGGRFLQFTYGFTSPVHPLLQRRLDLVGQPVSRVLLNIPPAVVWSYASAVQGRRVAGLPQAA
jgi:phosphatidylethanolamine/phosphatidyl-N-methylethanolamine N-methyltransferase